ILTLLLAFIACLIIGVSFSVPDNEELLKQMFTRKVHSNKEYGLVVAGDSRVYRGVSSNIIGKELNMASLNLGFSSAGFNKTMFDLIDKKLKDKPGNIIILGISPFSLTNQAIGNGHIKRVGNLKTEEVIEYLYLSKLMNIFVPTDPIKLWDNIFKKKPAPNNYVQKINVDEGWVASDYLQPNQYHALKSYKKTMTGTQVSEKTIEGLYDKIGDWVSEGYLVYGYIPPSSADIEELERQYVSFNDYDIAKGFIRAGGKWISLKDNYTSFDGSHLDSTSAVNLSYEIANAIKSKTYLSSLSKNSIIRVNYYPFQSKYDSLNNFENEMDGFFVTDIAHSGNAVLLCDSSMEYLGLFNSKTDYIVNNKIEKLLVDLYVYYEDENTSAKIVFDIIQNGTSILWTGLQVTYIVKPKNWGNVKFEIPVPENITSNDKLKIYIINSGKTQVLVDDFRLSMY
ncbi:MAG: hypothetical protein DRO16_05065, partial [Thermoprotei archaeon]